MYQELTLLEELLLLLLHVLLAVVAVVPGILCRWGRGRGSRSGHAQHIQTTGGARLLTLKKHIHSRKTHKDTPFFSVTTDKR
jgi:hypothetical protein